MLCIKREVGEGILLQTPDASVELVVDEFTQHGNIRSFSVILGGERVQVHALSAHGVRIRLGFQASQDVSILRDDAVVREPHTRVENQDKEK